MSTSHNRRLRVVANEEVTVDLRLRRAFPEVDFEAIARNSNTLNAHNLAEKWDATVRSMQFWVDLSRQ